MKYPILRVSPSGTYICRLEDLELHFTDAIIRRKTWIIQSLCTRLPMSEQGVYPLNPLLISLNLLCINVPRVGLLLYGVVSLGFLYALFSCCVSDDRLNSTV